MVRARRTNCACLTKLKTMHLLTILVKLFAVIRTNEEHKMALASHLLNRNPLECGLCILTE